MVSLFLLLGCNLSWIVDLFAALHELASASASTLLKLASSVRTLLKPYGDTLKKKISTASSTASLHKIIIFADQVGDKKGHKSCQPSLNHSSLSFFNALNTTGCDKILHGSLAVKKHSTSQGLPIENTRSIHSWQMPMQSKWLLCMLELNYPKQSTCSSC